MGLQYRIKAKIAWDSPSAGVLGPGICAIMAKHPILDVPLDQVMRAEIALPLQQVLRLYTVGNLLNAWRSPRNHKSIEQVFDTPQQARHAVAVCTAFLGFEIPAVMNPVPAWWTGSGQISC